jgi:hypothetical protein
LPLLLLLGKVHGMDATLVTLLASELTARMQELLDSEALVLPLIVWDDESPDPEERLALTHLESLIGTYEVKFWWYVRFAVLVCFATRFGAASYKRASSPCLLYRAWIPFCASVSV